MKNKTFDSSQGTITMRRISWREFFKIRPDLKPTAANDNSPAGASTSSKAV